MSLTPLDAARKALAQADTILPESEPWWELRCHRDHDIETFRGGGAEAEARERMVLGVPCDHDGCRYLGSRVERVQVPARKRSQSVAADHLRTALAAHDRLALVVAEIESAVVEAEDRGIAAGAREALATVTPSLLGCPVGWRESAQSIAGRAKGTLRLARVPAAAALGARGEE